MLMGSKYGMGRVGVATAASQLVWDSTQQKFVMAPSGIATGCWDQGSQSFLPYTASCNSQVLYTNNGVLPGAGVQPGAAANPLTVPLTALAPTLNVTGGTPVSSGTQTVMTTPSGDIVLGTFDATQFVSQYWPWLAGGVAAIAVLGTMK
jgi:hypothetical protein